MDKNFINIKAEELGEGTIQANFKGGVKNFNQLISLGGAMIQTYLQSAVEIIRQNTDEELDLPDEFIQLTIMDALIDKIGNLLNIQQDTDNESVVDSFLDDIINGMNRE